MKSSKSTLKIIRLLIAFSSVFIVTNSFGVSHEDGRMPYENIEAMPITIIQAPKTILDQDFKYPSGQPLIKAFNIEIPVGKQTDLHKHFIPLYIYVVSGVLEVDYGTKGKKTFKPGTSYVEAIEWCHIGKAAGKEPVKVIGVYLGEQSPDQIKPEKCAKPN